MISPHWNLNSTGKFTVKSVYNHINSTGNPTQDWNIIWRMNITPSVKIFVWKAAHSILSNSMRVAAVVPNIDTTCKLCNNGQESLTHLFLECNFAVQVWMHLNFDMQFICDCTTTFHDWLNNCFENPNRGNYGIEWQVLCSVTIWHIWKARCKITFEKKSQNSAIIANNIVKYLNSYLTVNNHGYNIMQTLYYNPLNDETLKVTKTEEPPRQMDIQINIAITMMNCDAKSGIGMTLCDFTGKTKEARGMYSTATITEQLEIEAAEAAFKWATDWSGHTITFRSNTEPILLLLIGKYAKARQQRFKISGDFCNNTEFDINFIVNSFALVQRSTLIWAANISAFCNKFSINYAWTGYALWAFLTFLNIQDWNQYVMVHRTLNNRDHTTLSYVT